MNLEFRVLVTEYQGRIYNKKTAKPIIEEMGNQVKVTFRKEDFASLGYFNHHLQKIRFECSWLTAKAGDPGYMFFQNGFGEGFVKTYFTPRENSETVTWVSGMPVCGICGNENAVFFRMEGMAADTRFHVEVRENVFRICPEVVLDCDDPYEDISMVFYKMPGAGYVEMAKLYRQYQLTEKGCVPLRDRAKDRPILNEIADAMEIRVRLGWKPLPTPVRHQTVENEPEMYVACTIEELNNIVDKLQAAGVKHAELCLVGWAVGGHDGRFPQQVPVDPRFGKVDADAEMKAFIQKAQGMGYHVVCHTVSCGAYEIADNWNVDYMCKKIAADNSLVPYIREMYKQGGLNGGEPWAVCPQTAYEKYAVVDLPKVKAYGYRGLHYVDELAAYTPDKCYDPNHPCNRKQAREYYQKIAKLSQDLFGGYQSEGAMDFMNANVDAILYTQIHSFLNNAGKGNSDETYPKMHPLFDDNIPFWQLVYHGIVMSNATSQTVNYTIKEEAQHLRFLEYGGRPLMYFNSKFGEERDWMGKVDLYNKKEEDLDYAVAAIKRAYDEYEKYKYLQYEFLDNHEQLENGVYRSTFSDGTVVTVNYNNETYTVVKDGKEI